MLIRKQVQLWINYCNEHRHLCRDTILIVWHKSYQMKICEIKLFCNILPKLQKTELWDAHLGSYFFFLKAVNTELL